MIDIGFYSLSNSLIMSMEIYENRMFTSYFIRKGDYDINNEPFSNFFDIFSSGFRGEFQCLLCIEYTLPSVTASYLKLTCQPEMVSDMAEAS